MTRRGTRRSARPGGSHAGRNRGSAAIPASFIGPVAGLTTAPVTAGWIATRPAWLPLFALLLIGIARFAQPLETPWTNTGPARRAMAVLLASAFAVFALA